MRTLLIDDKNEINNIIKACRTCYLGVVDKDGLPYVIPMNFGYDGEYIYLHSGQFGRKWQALKTNPKSCITFCLGEDLAWQDEHVACSWRVKSKTVIAEGEIEFIEDYDLKVEILNQVMAQYSDKTFKYNAPAVKNVGIMRMKIEKIMAKEFGAKAQTPWNS